MVLSHCFKNDYIITVNKYSKKDIYHSSVLVCMLLIVLDNNNNKHDNVYGAVIMAEPLREFTRFKPDDLGCESACTGCQKLHPPSPFIITQPES